MQYMYICLMDMYQTKASPLRFPQSPPPLHCWSELPLDLMQLIFERLGFTDFERAKSVCSSWLSGSRQSKPNNKIPWMILLPEEKNYFLLFNPEDREEKLYKTQHLGDDLASSVCLATCRSWLLMATLPHERDNSWKKISDQLSGSQKGMVFKDHKLYALTEEELRIFDFSGEFPLQVSRVNVGGCVKLEIKKIGGMRSPAPWEFYKLRRRSNVVLTLGGDVLIVRSKSPCMSCSWNFRIFKMDSSNGNIKWKEIFSLGDEAIILDLGITVLAKDQEGITSNSIYFTAHEMDWFDTDIFVFNLDTNKVEQLPQLVSSVSFTEARWFLPITRSGPKRNLHCWSELPLDLMRLVFDRLGFADFERARTVCPSWYSASRQSKPNNQIPWMFLIQKDKNYDYGLISPVLWIDEKTKDYLVIGMFDEDNAVSIKKGDTSGKPITQLQFPCIYECYNMVYKDHNIYCLDHYKLTIFYFSGHVPSQVFEISVDGCVNRTVAGAIRHPGTIPCKRYLACYKNSMVVTVDGDVLILNSVRESMSYIWDFKIYKMGSSTGSKWEEIFSLGDEAILLELGITVLAKDIEGIKRNSIYFNGSDSVNPYDEMTYSFSILIQRS
ncbi:hypothetical protein HID58_077986 [Brassica napus]|uniref:F-box domain-containing protein n=1 Tax=Brassica napus TaxID=3708 RepID=A0ABQ7YRW9_BRANA|nr:hypothetical protein HID58_077986 [Brassica napus]